jgi:hypothetical protein
VSTTLQPNGVVNSFHEFSEQRHDPPVVPRRTLNIATLPLLAHRTRRVPQSPSPSRPVPLPSTPATPGGRGRPQVCLVGGDHDRHGPVMGGPSIPSYLVAHCSDVAEAVVVADVVDDDVGGGMAQAVAAVVGPLLQRAGREPRDGRAVDETEVIQSVVDHHRGVVVGPGRRWNVGGGVVRRDVVVDKLADQGGLADTAGPEHDDRHAVKDAGVWVGSLAVGVFGLLLGVILICLQTQEYIL